MASPILGTRHGSWPDEAACGRAADAFATRPELAEALVELHGPLGAGKTTFVRHLLRALGVAGSIKSPTYALLEPYEVVFAGRPLSISHCDFYRFDDPEEWEGAGLRDVFVAPGLKLVEWPEKAAALPRPDLRLLIAPRDEGNTRDIVGEALSERGLALLHAGVQP